MRTAIRVEHGSGCMTSWRLGLDEAGRGPLLGPLCVGGLAVPAADIGELVSLGVTDSKALSPGRRAAIAGALHELADERGWWYDVRVLSPAEIDVGMQATNLNVVELDAFAALLRAALDVTEEEDHGIAGIDAFGPDPERLATRLRERAAPWPEHRWTIEAAHKADVHDPVVGGASILAKVARDAAVAELSAELGFELGSGYPSDPTTQAILPDLVEDATAPHPALRWQWAPVIAAFREAHGRDPPARSGPIPLPGGQQRLF